MTTWTIDTNHASAEFAARHMMVTTVRGQFRKITGTIEYDQQNPENAYVEAVIDAAAFDTGVTDRDNHLRSADFLDVENHPQLVFKSTKVEPTSESTAKITGDLTIRGVTRPVVIEAELIGVVDSPFGDTRVGFTGSTKINREDWGLTWNMALEAGGVLVGKEVKIMLDVQAILVKEAVPA